MVKFLFLLNSTVVPYLNYSTFSEPCDDGHGNTNTNVSLPPSLDPFDEEDWDMSMTSSLPTEFDLRPDLTPTGEEPPLLTFETPVVRASPSRYQGGYDTDMILEESAELNSDTNDQITTNSTQSTFSSRRCSLNFAKKKPQNQILVVVRTSILSSLLLLLLFSCLIVFIIESDSELFSHLRKLPELVVLRRDYYQPIKDSLLHSIGR